jgi:hypothetical protein
VENPHPEAEDQPNIVAEIISHWTIQLSDSGDSPSERLKNQGMSSKLVTLTFTKALAILSWSSSQTKSFPN